MLFSDINVVMCDVPEHFQSLPFSSLKIDYYLLIAVFTPAEIVLGTETLPAHSEICFDTKHGILTPIASAESKFFIHNSWGKTHLRSVCLKVKPFRIFVLFWVFFVKQTFPNVHPASAPCHCFQEPL